MVSERRLPLPSPVSRAVRISGRSSWFSMAAASALLSNNTFPPGPTTVIRRSSLLMEPFFSAIPEISSKTPMFFMTRASVSRSRMIWDRNSP